MAAENNDPEIDPLDDEDDDEEAELIQKKMMERMMEQGQQGQQGQHPVSKLIREFDINQSITLNIQQLRDIYSRLNYYQKNAANTYVKKGTEINDELRSSTKNHKDNIKLINESLLPLYQTLKKIINIGDKKFIKVYRCMFEEYSPNTNIGGYISTSNKMLKGGFGKNCFSIYVPLDPTINIKFLLKDISDETLIHETFELFFDIDNRLINLGRRDENDNEQFIMVPKDSYYSYLSLYNFRYKTLGNARKSRKATRKSSKSRKSRKSR